jgi:hypothetical protein
VVLSPAIIQDNQRNKGLQVRGSRLRFHWLNELRQHDNTQHDTSTTASNMASNFSTGSAYKAMIDKDDSSWKYPGEYGRVSAWVKRTRRDLELEKDIYGHLSDTHRL